MPRDPPVTTATRPCSENRSLNMWPSIGFADGSGRGPTMSQGSDSSPSPPVGEGGCDAKHRSRVRGLSPRMQTLIRRGLRIADAKASASYLKERRPEAAYGHLLPQGEEGRGATEPRYVYAAARGLKPFHTPVAGPEGTTAKIPGTWGLPLGETRGSAVRTSAPSERPIRARCS